MVDNQQNSASTRQYNVIAIEVPIVFNADGDHDHNGKIFALQQNQGALENIRNNFSNYAKTPHPLVRPLVLRARKGETVEIILTNLLPNRCVGIHLVADGYEVQTSDGAWVGQNRSSLAAPHNPTYPLRPCGAPNDLHKLQPNQQIYVWKCDREGVFPFHDAIRFG